MKDIVIALISGLATGSLITFSVTANHYTRKMYDKNIFQRIASIVNLGSNVYNDEKKINEIVNDKTKNKPDIINSDYEPEEGMQKPGDYWEKDY